MNEVFLIYDCRLGFAWLLVSSVKDNSVYVFLIRLRRSNWMDIEEIRLHWDADKEESTSRYVLVSLKMLNES